jgi:hypothetical protein
VVDRTRDHSVDEEAGRSFGQDAMSRALRVVKMDEPGLMRAGTGRTWKRLSASYHYASALAFVWSAARAPQPDRAAALDRAERGVGVQLREP